MGDCAAAVLLVCWWSPACRLRLPRSSGASKRVFSSKGFCGLQTGVFREKLRSILTVSNTVGVLAHEEIMQKASEICGEDAGKNTDGSYFSWNQRRLAPSWKNTDTPIFSQASRARSHPSQASCDRDQTSANHCFREEQDRNADMHAYMWNANPEKDTDTETPPPPTHLHPPTHPPTHPHTHPHTLTHTHTHTPTHLDTLSAEQLAVIYISMHLTCNNTCRNTCRYAGLIRPSVSRGIALFVGQPAMLTGSPPCIFKKR